MEAIIDSYRQLGTIAWAAGDLELAIHYCEEALRRGKNVDYDLFFLYTIYYVLARVAMTRGEREQAIAL